MTSKERDKAISEIKFNSRWLVIFAALGLGLLICQAEVKASETMLVSDYDFTNRAWSQTTVDTFMTSFSKTRLKNEDRIEIIRYAWNCRLNVFVVICKLEQENSLITGDYPKSQHEERMRRAMGWGVRNPKHLGFQNQLEGGCRMLRRCFDDWKPGYRKKIHPGRSNERVIIPENAATFALYEYCPWYGRFSNISHFGARKEFQCEGNTAFVRLWREWKPRWEANQ